MSRCLRGHFRAVDYRQRGNASGEGRLLQLAGMTMVREPQQATEPFSASPPQAWERPALMEANSPASGVA